MLLKVQCEKCKTKYKLEEARIQGKGAKITCPKCRHVFVVMKDTLKEAEGEDEGGSELGDSTSEPVGPSARLEVRPRTETAVEVRPVEPKAPEVHRPPESPRAPEAPKALEVPKAEPVSPVVERPGSAESLNWKEVGLTSFKVKVAIGLVYDFSDIGTLRKYIAEKRVAPTDRLSFDGKTWNVIKEIPDLDGFFIDQWVALKTDRLKEDKTPGRTSSGATLSGGKSPKSVVNAKPEAGADPSAARKTAWSADASADAAGSGLLGQGLFDDVGGGEESALLAAAQARRATEAPRPTGIKGKPPVPVPEARSGGSQASTVIRDVGRGALPMPMPMPVPINSGLKPSELAILGVLILVAGYLGYRLVAEQESLAQVPEGPASGDVTELDGLLKTHFPFSLTGQSRALPQTPEAVPAPKAQVPAEAAPESSKPTTDAAAQKPVDASKKDAKGKDADKKGSVQVGNITADDLFQLAQESLKARDFEGAIQSLQSAVAMKPGNTTYQYTLGIALLQAGKDADAESAFKKSLSGAPARKEAHKWLGELYARRGQKAQAIEAWNKYLEGSPKDADAIRKKLQQLSNS